MAGWGMSRHAERDAHSAQEGVTDARGRGPDPSIEDRCSPPHRSEDDRHKSIPESTA
jgi:hypothetical protein